MNQRRSRELETLCSSGKLRVNIIVPSGTRVHRVEAFISHLIQKSNSPVDTYR